MNSSYLRLAGIAGLCLLLWLGPPHKVDPVIKSGPITIVRLEDALQGTPASDAIASALHQYCHDKNDKKYQYRCWDVNKSRDPQGNFPTAWEKLLTDFQNNGGPRRDYILSTDTGEVLWSGPEPATKEDTLALVKKYGG